MGSKLTMLSGSLGERLDEAAKQGTRFVDLFAGSGAVARHVARTVAVPVVAVDLMNYSALLSGATIQRKQRVDASKLWREWSARARDLNSKRSQFVERAAGLSQPQSEAAVIAARTLCSQPIEGGFVWRDYGGYYFSPTQSLQLSALIATAPERAPRRTVALAALLRAASRASASPGHTAQPFRPTDRLLPHIRAAWRVDIYEEVQKQLYALAEDHALIAGTTWVGSAQDFVDRRLRDGDVLFCDPPYSEAQYSRFYHVLEGIARGGWPSVSGAGRAPVGSLRESSEFSRRTTSVDATLRLIRAAAKRRVTMLWTYPEGERSNGLTVESIREIARQHFEVEETLIPMRHSTLGGSSTTNKKRAGRKELNEVLLEFRPR